MGSLEVFFKEIKFEHSLFALPFAYLGLFLAERGWPSLYLFVWVTAAMVAFRTFAMAMNRLIDREIDSQNPRTKFRALPQHQLSPRFVKVSAALSAVGFLGSVWMLGPICFFLSPVPLILAAVYSFLKRFTWLSHGVLGIILGISPYGAWLASRGEFSWVPTWLLVGVTCWVAGFDILYSLQDVEFDRNHSLKSVPVRFGQNQALGVAAALHLMALFAWFAAGEGAALGSLYQAGLSLVALFLVREHWLIHRFGLAKIDQAFFTMNAGVSVTVFLAAAADLSLAR